MCGSLVIKEVECVFMFINISIQPALKNEMKDGGGGGWETNKGCWLTLFLARKKKKKKMKSGLLNTFQINSEVHQLSIKEEQCVHGQDYFWWWNCNQANKYLMARCEKDLSFTQAQQREGGRGGTPKRNVLSKAIFPWLFLFGCYGILFPAGEEYAYLALIRKYLPQSMFETGSHLVPQTQKSFLHQSPKQLGLHICAIMPGLPRF